MCSCITATEVSLCKTNSGNLSLALNQPICEGYFGTHCVCPVEDRLSGKKTRAEETQIAYRNLAKSIVSLNLLS